MSLSESDLNASSIIHRALDTELNSIILEGFFCGIYTVLFGYTLSSPFSFTSWRHTGMMHRADRLVRTPGRKIYTASLIVLWTLVMTTFACDWTLQRSILVVNNSSPMSMFDAIYSNTGIRHLGNAFSASTTLLADGILIWRCFILWPDKKWLLSPLPVALAANVVIASFIFFQQPYVHESLVVTNNLILAFFFMSAGITVVGTFLIILRILLVTRESPLSIHHSAYRRIQAIVLESGIIYAIAIMVPAITIAVQTYAKLASQTTANVVAGYSESLLTPLSGIGPTLIAARIGMEAGETKMSETRPMTHLTFMRTTGRDNTSGFGSDLDRAGGFSEERNDSEKQEQVGTVGDSRRIETMVYRIAMLLGNIIYTTVLLKGSS